MRVIFLTPSVRPLGARRSLLEMLANLPKLVEPLVICPALEGIALEIRGLGVPVAIAPQGAWRKVGGRLTAIFRQIPEIRRQVARFSPHLLHSNEYHCIPQGLAGTQGKLPVFGHVRLSVTHRQLKNYEIGACRRVVCVSKAVQNLFEGTPVAPITRVVYNGVSLEKMQPGPPHPQVWEKLGDSTPKPLVVGLLGLVSERKNQLVAAEAVAKARKLGADVRILFAGDAFQSSEAYGALLRQRLAQPDLRDCSIWLPFQSDVAALYRSIDVNLLISNDEGFGRTIIEAGSLARPSVGTWVGGIPELIEDGRTGWLVDEGDVDGLAQVLLSAYNDRPLVKERGDAMRRSVEENFTIQAHVRRMIEVWEEGLAEDLGDKK